MTVQPGRVSDEQLAADLAALEAGAMIQHDHLSACLRELQEAREALRANVGDAYNLLTQGESPRQLRRPSAERIYERSLKALGGGS